MYQSTAKWGICLVLATLLVSEVQAKDVVVGGGNMDCALRDGSEDAPYCTIQEGVDAAFAAGGGTVRVQPGIYEERVRLRSDLELNGDEDGPVVIQPPLDAGAAPHVVVGADEVHLKNITIRLPAGYSAEAVLLHIPNVRMELEDIILDGGLNPRSTGILIEGPRSSETSIKKTLLTRLNVGIEAVDSGAQISRNLFTEILRDAIYVRPPDSGSGPFLVPELGDDDVLDLSGFNRFRVAGGSIPDDDDKGLGGYTLIRNTTGETLYAQLNDWGAYDEAAIAARLTTAPPAMKEGLGTDKQESDVLFVPFIGKSVFPGSIYVRVEDRSTGLSLPGASVQLRYGGVSTGLAPTFDPLSGLFGFEGIAPSTYSVHAAAPGYTARSVVISLAPGEIAAREISLSRSIPVLDPPILMGTIPASPSTESAPMIAGTAPPNTIVHLLVDGSEVMTSTAKNVQFDARCPELSLGVHTIRAYASRADYADSAPSNELLYEVISMEGGGGHVSDLEISPTQLDFGPVAVGAVMDKTVFVQNIGSSQVAGLMSASAPFSVLGSGGFSVPPQETLQMVIRFAPEEASAYEAEVSIAVDSMVSIPLTGTGVIKQTSAQCAASTTNQGRVLADWGVVCTTLLLLFVAGYCQRRTRLHR